MFRHAHRPMIAALSRAIDDHTPRSPNPLPLGGESVLLPALSSAGAGRVRECRVVFALASTLLLCALGFSYALAAPQTAVRDPQALSLIASALKALSGSANVTDVTLQATASYVAGSDEETGTATLVARGNQESLVQLNLSGGTRQEIRNGPAGAWSGPDATPHSMANHNCFTDASWFFPALTLEAVSADPTIAVSYLGPDTSKSATPLLHLQVAHTLPGQSAGANQIIQVLSTMDIYFDPQSFLPLVLDFNTHPDVDAGRDLQVEIQFGNYQNSSGVLVPFRIQRFLQRTLLIDLTVTNVVVNSGVPDSAFILPDVAAGGGQ